MNEIILILFIAVLIFIQVKILKGMLKTIVGIIIFIALLICGNYLLLPKVGLKPFPIGLEGFFF